MIKIISRLKMILFLLVMAALCGGYAAGADMTVKPGDYAIFAYDKLFYVDSELSSDKLNAPMLNDVQKKMVTYDMITDTSIMKWTIEQSQDGTAYYIKDTTGKYLNFTYDGTCSLQEDQPVNTEIYEKDGRYYFVQRNGDNMYLLYCSISGNVGKIGGSIYTGTLQDLTSKTDKNSYFTLRSRHLETVKSVPADVTVRLFNYGGSLTKKNLGLEKDVLNVSNASQNEISAILPFGNNTTSVDGNASLPIGSYEPVAHLNANGMPQGTLKGTTYDFDKFFNGEYAWESAVMNNGGGLFQQDADGYYYYDCTKNAASYNPETNSFDLYNATLFNEFYPWNRIDGHSYPDSAGTDLKLNGSGADARDFWFGLTLDFNMTMPQSGLMHGKDTIFDFSGDDDVLLYIDGVLVLDISGIHVKREGFINFTNGTVKDYPSSPVGVRTRTLKEIFGLEGDTFEPGSKHTLKMFYLERGGDSSDLKVRFNFSPKPEPSEGGPFYVVSLKKDYPTLQEAVDKAAATDTILIHPCADYGVTEYGSSYATYNTDYIGDDGGEVYIEGKSLTIKSEKGKNTAPLKDFAIVVEGQETGLDYAFEDIKFTGSSIIIFDNYAANANFGKITVTGCDADTCTSTSGRSLLKYPTHNLGLTHSSSAFLQWVQYPPNVHAKNGTTKELVFTGNTVKGTLHPTNPGKDQELSPAYTPYINGGAGVGKVTITGNTFGDYAHAGNAIYGIVFQTVVDGADINVSNNTAYMCNRSSTFVWVGEFQTTTKIYDVYINVNNNDIYTGTKWAPTRPYSLNSTFDVATPAFSVVRINDNLNGKAVTHHNYVNKFCYNYIRNSVMSASTFEVDSQIGHTDDERIIEVPKGYKKFNDIYLFGKADTFTGGDHADREIGDDHYCKVCDELIELEATFTYTAVCKKELAEGESFGSVTPTEEKVGKVTGTPAGSVAEAADGFRFIGWFDNEACEGTALSTELTYVPPVVRDEDELLIGDDFYALFDSAVRTLIIEKSGLNAGDRAIFTVTKKGDTAPMYTVPVTAGADGSGKVTIKDVAVGEYTVAETSWSWAYEKVQPLTQDITENNTFTFKNTPKKDSPPHAEVEKNNVLKEKKN